MMLWNLYHKLVAKIGISYVFSRLGPQKYHRRLIYHGILSPDQYSLYKITMKIDLQDYGHREAECLKVLN